MKHVLLFDIGKDFGGAETYIMQLMNGLPQEGFKCFLCVRAQSAFAIYLDDHYPDNEKFRFDFSHFVASLRLLRQYVQKKQIDLIHCNGINSMVVAQLVNLTLHLPAVATIHGDAVLDRMGKPIIVRKLYAGAEVFLHWGFQKYIAVSEDLKYRLAARKVPKGKVTVVHNGVDMQQYPVKGERCHFVGGKVHILSIGRLEKVKNFELLLTAVENCVNKLKMQILCDIYGTGSQQQALQETIVAKGLEHIVTLKGYVDSSAINYDAYDIYIQPSHYESFGMAAAEAMLNRVLCFTSAVGGMCEVNAKNAQCCFADNDINALTDLIVWASCLSNSQMNELEQAADQYVRANFSCSRMLQETVKVYKQC